MGKYKYILTYDNGEVFDSMEEYGDDDYEGTFATRAEAKRAALYAVKCYHEGGEILNMNNPGDYPYDEDDDDSDDVEIEIERI